MAATPIDVRVADQHRAAMLACSANAHSSEHSAGVAAQAALDEAASDILQILGKEGSALCFTPGASAALWLAIEDCIERADGRVARI